VLNEFKEVSFRNSCSKFKYIFYIYRLEISNILSRSLTRWPDVKAKYKVTTGPNPNDKQNVPRLDPPSFPAKAELINARVVHPVPKDVIWICLD
jgi:hypothetical protein